MSDETPPPVPPESSPPTMPSDHTVPPPSPAAFTRAQVQEAVDKIATAENPVTQVHTQLEDEVMNNIFGGAVVHKNDRNELVSSDGKITPL